MATITNGTVEIERVVRPADFESKRVKVALSFAIDEAEEAAHVIEHVGQMAHDKLMGMLHRVESRLYGTSPAAAALPEVKAENAAKAEKLAAGPTLGAVATAVSEPAPAITDAQVLAAIQAVAGRFQGSYDPDMVKKVIWKHAGAVGASYTTIPATDPRRQALLDELNAMKPAGAVGASYTTIPATDPRRQELLDKLNAMKPATDPRRQELLDKLNAMKPAAAALQQAQGPVQLAY